MYDNRHISQTLAIAVWMSTLWLTEVIPQVVTDFSPLILLSVFAILSSSDTAAQFIKGNLLALRCWPYGRLDVLTMGFASTFFTPDFDPLWDTSSLLALWHDVRHFLLSMIVSNTATTLMTLPNAISVVAALEDSGPLSRHCPKFGEALWLGIAHSSSVGSMSSLIGTGPNLVLHRQLRWLFPAAPELTFSQWIVFGLPTGLVVLAIIWASGVTSYQAPKDK
jgi:solute carrier family 13 (sodium-dependent dicarboxylate transporter), member 2/3/5